MKRNIGLHFFRFDKCLKSCCVCVAAWVFAVNNSLADLPKPNAVCHGFVARGTIGMYESVSPDKLLRVLEFTAIINTETKQYLLSVKRPATKDGDNQFVQIIGSDGVDHYLSGQIIGANQEVLGTSHEVGKGVFPYRAESTLQELWLLCVLDRYPLTERPNLMDASRRLEFFSLNNLAFNTFKVEAQAYLYNTNLIRSIHYYHPGFEINVEGEKVKYDHGEFLIASLEKGELVITEFGLPSETVFATHMQTHTITNRDDVPPFTWDKIHIISCVPYFGTEKLLPPIKSGDVVNDYRFSDELNGKHVGYLCDNSQWFLRSDTRLQNLYRDFKINYSINSTGKKTNNLVFCLLVILIFIPPVFMGIYYLMERKHASSKAKQEIM